MRLHLRVPAFSEFLPGVLFMIRYCQLICLAAVTMTANHSVVHANAPNDNGDDWLLAHVHVGHRTQDVARIEEQLMRLFLNTDVDGGGVSEKDYELADQVQAARKRSTKTSKMLAWDLNGDQSVSRAELDIVLGHKARQPIRANGMALLPSDAQIKKMQRELISKALKQDLNADGQITIDEMGQEPKGMRVRSAIARNARNRVPLTLDSNGDRVVTLDEFKTAVARVIGQIDQDSNGEISADEAAKVKARIQSAKRAIREEQRERAAQARARSMAKKCNLPKPSSEAHVILLGAYEGKALSAVSLGGDDEVVTAASVEIEAGTNPLYVVATSYAAMIWNVTGNASRVEKFVVTSHKQGSGKKTPRAGVAGLSKDRVAVMADTACLTSFHNPRKTKTRTITNTLAGLIGTAPDQVLGDYGISRVALPSGTFAPKASFPNARLLPMTGPSAAVWRSMRRFNPAGLADIDPEAVVSALPARHYQTLPQQAGLAQLVEDGALELSGSSRARVVNGIEIVGEGRIVGGNVKRAYRVPRGYRIAKKMRFPAGLSGAHSVKFILGKGVPFPDGDPGHSRVVDEETGKRVFR